MTIISKLKEQFFQESLIKDIESEAEHIRKYIFAELAKNTIEFEELLKTPEAIEYKSEEFYGPQIEWNKKVLAMEVKYLNIKNKFKDDVGTRLSVAKDWNLYMQSLELLIELSGNCVSDIWGEFTNDQKNKNKEEERECHVKLQEIENRFERLLSN